MKLTDIYNEVAEDLDISPELVEYCYRNKCEWLRRALTNLEAPAVLDNKLGTFFVAEYKIDERLETKKAAEDKEYKTLYMHLKDKVHAYNESKKNKK